MDSHRPVVFRGGLLSNFAPSPVMLRRPDGSIREYRTVEHFFQASKTLDLATHDRVADAPTPREAKRIGRAAPLRADWEEVKRSVMLDALRAKYVAEPFRSRLLSTGDRSIIEESRHDLEWGARRHGAGWEGKNGLGKLLVQVRAELVADGAVNTDCQLRF